MKIIMPGKSIPLAIETTEEQWWIGMEGTCSICGAIVQIEPDDIVLRVQWVGYEGVQSVYAPCPNPNPHPQATSSIRMMRPGDDT